MKLESPALEANGSFPVKYTRDGEDASPPLRWSDVPPGTRELALVFENLTPSTEEPAPMWLVYKIPPEVTELPEDLTRTPEMDEPVPVLQGRNHLDMVGYDAPLGAEGRTFRYRFRLMALDKPLDLPAAADGDALSRAVEGHVIEETALPVTYERPR